MARKLSPLQQDFVREYLVDLNATQAAIRAGYSEKTAQQQSSRLLLNVVVQKEIQRRRQSLISKIDVTPEKVLEKWWSLSQVDVNELVEYRRVCCRHCWGIGHKYQWVSEDEYERAKREADGDDPGMAGGFGFIATRAPHPECPECQGEGRGKIHVHDTRKLKGAARELYNGVHQGKDGLKLLLRDRDKALEQVTKILGMYESQEVKDRAQELHRLEVEAKRLAISKAAKELEDPNGDLPTPVKVVVEVKDARKRDNAEP